MLGEVKDATLPSIEATEVDWRGERELFSLGCFPFNFHNDDAVERNRSANPTGVFRGARRFVCLPGNDEDILSALHASFRRRQRRIFNNSLNRRCSGRVGLMMQNHDLLLKETFSKNLLPMSR